MNLFFIVGSGRCGTQMLRNMLLHNKNIAILPETHFIIPLYDKYKLDIINCDDFLEVIDNVYSSEGDKWIKVILNGSKKKYVDYKQQYRNYVKLHNINGSIKDYIEGFYSFLFGKKFLIGDKTPHYGANLEIILKIWPDSKIIYLKRDGVNTALSMMKHPAFVRDINGNVRFSDIGRVKYQNLEKNFSKKSPSIEKAIKFWRECIDQTDDSITKMKKKKDFELLNIKYEDLVYNSNNTLKLIYDFLGLEANKLAFYKGLCEIKPFTSYKKILKISKVQYHHLYKICDIQMKKHGYPYLVQKNQNHLIESLRFIGHYFFNLVNLFKFFFR